MTDSQASGGHPAILMTMRKLMATLLACNGLLFASAAAALGLGAVAQQSAIGEPLRIRIELIGAGPEVDSGCLRLAPGLANDLPWVRQARMAIERNANASFLVVSSPKPVYHPILMLGVETGCESSMRREYALLLGPAQAVGSPAAAEPPPSAAKPSTPAEARTAPPQRTPSLIDLARQNYPDNRAARQRFIAAARTSNPELFPDRASLGDPLPDNAALDLDALRAIAEKPPVRKRPAVAPARAADSPGRVIATAPSPSAVDTQHVAAPTAPDQASDRLRLFGGEPAPNLKLSFSLSAAPDNGRGTDEERERLRREQQLVMALDQKIMSQMELANRIRELEQLQSRLRAESTRLDALTQDHSAGNEKPTGPVLAATAPISAPPAPAVEQPRNWLPLAGGLAALLLAGGLALLWWRRRGSEYEDVELDTLAPEEEPPSEPPRSIEVDIALDEDVLPAPEDSVDAEDLTSRFAELEGPASSMDFGPLEWSPPADDLSAATVAPLGEDELADEHESAVELADIMMSFGRIQGAAQTLADFIRQNPKQGVAPWLKLLDVYKAAGMRTEFDALTQQLNSTFNVMAVTWDDFDVVRIAAQSLESMPHIVAKLTRLWPTRECQVYLHALLRDNRDGTRQGFPIAVVDELLCLLSVLNELAGPFRARPGDFDDSEALAARDDASVGDARAVRSEAASKGA